MILVRFNKQLITINTLKKIIPIYWYYKITNDFQICKLKQKTYKIYNGAKITLYEK